VSRRIRTLGVVLGSLRYLGSCACCGRQFVSVNDRVVEAERGILCLDCDDGEFYREAVLEAVRRVYDMMEARVETLADLEAVVHQAVLDSALMGSESMAREALRHAAHPEACDAREVRGEVQASRLSPRMIRLEWAMAAEVLDHLDVDALDLE